MARSKKRITTGETTRMFRPPKQQKIKKKRIWPYFFFIILLSVSAYYLWEGFLKKPNIPIELTRPQIQKEEKTNPVKQHPGEDNFRQDTKPQNDIKKEPPAALAEERTDPDKQLIIPKDMPSMIQKNIQVEILNGCGIQGMAARFAKILRQNNIDVVKTGNYKSLDVQHSQVLDRIGNPEFAGQVGRILGIDKKYIYTQKQKELLIDATVIIGKDYKKLNTK